MVVCSHRDMPRPRCKLEIYWILQSILGCATGPQTIYEEISVGMVTLQSCQSRTEAALPVCIAVSRVKWRQDVAQMSAAVVFKKRSLRPVGWICSSPLTHLKCRHPSDSNILTGALIDNATVSSASRVDMTCRCAQIVIESLPH